MERSFAMQGLRVGHTTIESQGTGVTAFVFDTPTVGVYHLCGSSPASHELHALDLAANVSHVNGLLFCGGSALGLGAVAGAMQWFLEQGRGWPVPQGVMPIVPAAAIYDLGVISRLPPGPDAGYQACAQAEENNVSSGRIGAGTGASVGKIITAASRMSGGLGYASLRLADGVTVCAYAVVNSVGDVRDADNKIIAGAKNSAGKFADCQQYLLDGKTEEQLHPANSTLVAVFTDAHFSRAELKRISRMAVAGLARVISPVFTRYDGDIIFTLSLGELSGTELIVGTAAAQVVQEAIINSVKNSIILKL
jgi:L-aminopeptidase/D-esterase-like protein